MGDFKPLLPFRDSTIIEEIIDTLESAGVSPIVVVTGFRADDIERQLSGRDVHFVVNHDFMETDMFRSAGLGLKEISGRARAAFFLPGDAPLFSAGMLEDMYREMERTGADIIIPCHNGKGGHPVLISRSAIPGLLTYGGKGGLRGALKNWKGTTVKLEVNDIGILLDADHPGDYELIRLLARPGSPDKLRRHSDCVARLAVSIGKALNTRGFSLDLNMIELGALLHDMAKGEPDHAREGGRRLLSIGQTELAEIVRRHTDPDESQLGGISEITVVFLADKLVKRDRPVTVWERYRLKEEALRNDPSALRSLDVRRERALRVLELFEAALGEKIDSERLLEGYENEGSF